ncbi:proteasome assembly chaperone 4 isoform X1 [Sorghum bicolor]|uniref:proteasome assembly chaperone 4 isoform X1 n=1 Tax=Sorghum bicolor TaxID=4558 RepID=UPI000B424C5F|nr:proteasome assembly chaperone 4 isoform X1 [Sorghum bicolor]XP_021313155.1 proteasome assembly chaperone 4 isoform X1 [Sorghum bicolor]|eukprot:XP_021313154.1 proteasome assembly chaperone 4 isoform X1 [Sorghum bicolor]
MMSSEELRASFSDLVVCSPIRTEGKTYSSGDLSSEEGVQVTSFTEDLHDVTLHFQIMRFSKQIYVWVGCNTTKFGHLYAAATTRPDNRVSVTSVLGGTSDNTGSTFSNRKDASLHVSVLKTGLNIVLACNIPKDSPILEAAAERKLVEKLKGLGYIKTAAVEANTSTAQ